MRISTQGAYLQGLSLMQQLQSSVGHAQKQIASGRRILSPSDDPIAAARTIEFRESLSKLQQFDRNAGIAENRLNFEESALTTANNLLQRVRELTLQANNATQSDETRGLIAIEMRQHLDHLVQIANQQDGNGQFLFAGNLGDTQPVSRSGANFVYNGDQGQRQIQIGPGRTVADNNSGADVFFAIRNGNGTFSVQAGAANNGTGKFGAGSVVDPTAYDQDQYTVTFVAGGNYEVADSGGTVISVSTFQDGDTVSFRGIEFSIDGQPAVGDQFVVSPSVNQDMFTTLDQLITSIEQPVTDDASRTRMNNSLNSGLLAVDQALGNILDIRTQVGSRLAAIETQLDNNSAFSLTLQETIGELEDLDFAEALSRLSSQISVLEAAQQSFVRTQGLSLFNFL